MLSSRHFPSGLREKRFANVGKKHASTVSRHILNRRQPKLQSHYCHKKTRTGFCLERVIEIYVEGRFFSNVAGSLRFRTKIAT